MATMANETITKRLQIVGSTSGLDRMAAEFERLIRTQHNFDESIKRAGASVLNAGQQFERLERRLSPLAKAQHDLERGLRIVNNALSQGKVEAERFSNPHSECSIASSTCRPTI